MPLVSFRQIKAKPINWQPFYDEIAKTLDDTVTPELIAWFDKVTKSWKHKPDFRAKKRITKTEASVYVYPVGENANIWRYVSQGTKGPYPIPKPGNKRAKTLRFQWAGRGSYKARTTPQGGYKGPGKSTGSEMMFKHVNHPGIKARNFERHIARWYRPQFRRAMRNAVARGLRKANAA